MKKLISLALCAALFATLLTGCGNKPSVDDPNASGNKRYPNGEVNVYNWGLYIDEALIDAFEQEHGIKVNYNTYESNETLYSTLAAGMGEYDVIVPSDYLISRLIGEDKLAPLDFSKLPNASDIDPALENPIYDPQNQYSVPYMWGTVGIIYNTTMVEGEVTGWSALFDERYSGQILMFDNSRDAIGIALKYLGYSYNTTNEAEIRAAVDLLIEQKPLVQSYTMDGIFDILEGGSAAMGPYYAGDYFIMSETNPDLAFCLPEEGTNQFVDALCIPKGAANIDNAHTFINFLCSTDAGLANVEEIGYSTPLLSVRAALDPEVATDPISYPSEEVILTQCEVYRNLPQNILDLYDSEWLRLKR